MIKQYDIVIVGGGLVGTTLALALANTSWRVALVEANVPPQPTSSNDLRAIALSYGSQQIFTRLGVWDEIKDAATAIKKIHVSEQKRFGNTLLDAHDIKLDAFGYVVPILLLYNAISQRLMKEIATATSSPLNDINNVVIPRSPKGDVGISSNTEEIATADSQVYKDNIAADTATLQSRNDITLLRPAKVSHIERKDNQWYLTVNDEIIQTTLLIAADGDRSFIRESMKIAIEENQHQETAIVSSCALAKPHEYTAYERFTPQGTLAMMPLQNQRAAIIWAMPNALAENMLAQANDEFLNEVQNAFGYRLGKLSDLGKRQSYPLKELHTDQQTLPGLILLGNAAHVLHPIAAQGFNLSLRDVNALAKIISHAKDLSDETLLKNYLEQRKPDQEQTERFTQRLVKLFKPKRFPFPHLRSLGLLLFDLLPNAKNEFSWRRVGSNT